MAWVKNFDCLDCHYSICVDCYGVGCICGALCEWPEFCELPIMNAELALVIIAIVIFHILLLSWKCKYLLQGIQASLNSFKV